MYALAQTAVFVATVISVATGAWTESLAQESKKEPTGSITGRVTVGGKAARGVAVMLTKAEPSPFPTPGSKATTDEDGHFRLTGVPAGRYNVAPFTPAFVVPSEGEFGQPGKIVTLSDGEAVEGIDFSLTRGGVITGRVTDSDGRPVIGKNVQVIRVDDRRQERPFYFSRFETDDRGVYRIYGLVPGRYVVAAGEPGDGSVIMMGPRGGHYTRVFHPDVTDQSRATVIEVTAGGEATGVDITLGRASKTYAASGRIIDADSGKPVANVMYGHGPLRNEGRSIGGYGMTGNRSNARGEFRIEGLTPGRFAAFVVSESQTDFYSEPAVFEITNSDVTGLEIKVRRGSTISGTAVIDGTSDPNITTKLSQLELYASVQSQELGAPPYGQIKIGPDGSFRITGLRPGKARISLGGWPRPKGFSIIRVERDGQEVQRDGIEINSGEHVTGVRVVIGYGSGVIRGQVKVQGGELPEGLRLFVVARRAGSESPQGPSAQVDARMRFVIEGLSPGDYEIVLNGGGPSTRLPTVKQNVSVTDGAESEVTLVLDLSAKDKDGEK